MKTEPYAALMLRIAELEIDSTQLDAYNVLLAEEIEASVRLERGVLFLYAVAVKHQPELIRVIEGYADEAAYAHHINTPHFLKYKSETAAMVKALRLIDTTPIELKSKPNIFSVDP